VDVVEVQEEEERLAPLSAQPADRRVDLGRTASAPGIEDSPGHALGPARDPGRSETDGGLVTIEGEPLGEPVPGAHIAVGRGPDPGHAHVARVVQPLGERVEGRAELVRGGDDAVGEWIESREERGVARHGPAGVRVGREEANPLGGQRIDVRTRVAAVAVGAQVVGAQRVDRDEQHVRPVARSALGPLPAEASNREGGEDRQTRGEPQLRPARAGPPRRSRSAARGRPQACPGQSERGARDGRQGHRDAERSDAIDEGTREVRRPPHGGGAVGEAQPEADHRTGGEAARQECAGRGLRLDDRLHALSAPIRTR
jgi:hypothetical protein